jgi:hypothetical protein
MSSMSKVTSCTTSMPHAPGIARALVRGLHVRRDHVDARDPVRLRQSAIAPAAVTAGAFTTAASSRLTRSLPCRAFEKTAARAAPDHHVGLALGHFGGGAQARRFHLAQRLGRASRSVGTRVVCTDTPGGTSCQNSGSITVLSP